MTSTTFARRKALIFLLERPQWEWAKAISYAVTFGIEEGLKANNVDCFMVPCFLELPSNSHLSWLSYVKDLYAGITFDMVWVWLAHSKLDEQFLAQLAELAPVRIGFSMESMTYADHPAIASDDALRERAQIVEHQCRFLTHALTVDEKDAETLSSKKVLPATWWPSCVPKRFIRNSVSVPKNQQAVFIGSSYVLRQKFLENPQLQELLMSAPSPEAGTDVVKHFERLNFSFLEYLEHSIPRSSRYLERHVEQLRAVREKIFANWMQTLSELGAVVNLPSLCQCYPGRVVEGMAAGRPVVSSRVPERPKTASLFEDGEEILLFDGESPEELREILLRLRSEPALGEKIAAAALAKLQRFHTAEYRIGQVLRWLDANEKPVYS